MVVAVLESVASSFVMASALSASWARIWNLESVSHWSKLFNKELAKVQFACTTFTALDN